MIAPIVGQLIETIWVASTAHIKRDVSRLLDSSRVVTLARLTVLFLVSVLDLHHALLHLLVVFLRKLCRALLDCLACTDGLVLHRTLIRLSLLKGKFNPWHGATTSLRILFTHIDIAMWIVLTHHCLRLRLLHVLLEGLDAALLQDELGLILGEDGLLWELLRRKLPLEVPAPALFEFESVRGAHSYVPFHELEIDRTRISLDVFDELLVERVFL